MRSYFLTRSGIRIWVPYWLAKIIAKQRVADGDKLDVKPNDDGTYDLGIEPKA